MRRIAILTNDDPTQPSGGAGVVVARQIELLKDEFEIQVWCHKADWLQGGIVRRVIGHVSDIANQPHYSVILANAGNHQEPRMDSCFHRNDRIGRRSMVDDLTAWKPDVLLTHNLTGIGFATPNKVKLKTGARWIHVLHDVQLFEPSGRLQSARQITLWQRLWSSLRQRVFGKPDLVLSPTQWLLDQHYRRGWFTDVKSVILPNPGPAKRQIERAPHDPLRLLFVGRVSEDKGSRILKALIEKCPWAELWLAGVSSDDWTNVARVTNFGPVASSRVVELMAEADVLLVPSQIEENQPTVILEAAACSLPIIASAIGGIPETLRDAGTLCPPNDLEAWLVAIHAMRDSSRYQESVARSKALSQNFDATSYRQTLLNLLKG